MKSGTKRAMSAFALIGCAASLSAASGCFALGEGLEPPLQEFYYPTAIVTSPGGHVAYVVNSDFDIQYTGGTVQALDLDSLRLCTDRLARRLGEGASATNACAELGLGLNEDPVVVPGPCAPIDVSSPLACSLSDDSSTVEVEGTVAGPLIRSSRIVGAFASAAALMRNPNPGAGEPAARLFVAVRGDPSVTYFDITDDEREPDADPFRLDCGAVVVDNDPVGGRCGKLNQIGRSPYQSSRPLRLPVEPVGIAASDGGASQTVFPLVGVHQTTASASLLMNKWSVDPTLEHVLSGLPDGPSDVAAIPTPAFVRRRVADGDTSVDYQPSFVASYRASRSVDILRYYDDSESTVARHFLQRVAGYFVLTNSDGSDSRGVALDPSERKACEAGCNDVESCLRACLDIPIGVYIANRLPASLLIGKLSTTILEEEGEVRGIVDSITIDDMEPLTTGPSRVITGAVLDANGRSSPRIMVVSFDSRSVFIYNPLERRIETVVHTGRGPQALAVDVVEDADGALGHAYLYVAHFTDSYIGVVDLDTRRPITYGSIIASVGKPTPPKESN
ncbi:MAG: hypothetical protein IPK82_40400 [Polyangiaceae bacterium]|nr:hypothetical protein [Polyangiaceae bacterium]